MAPAERLEHPLISYRRTRPITVRKGIEPIRSMPMRENATIAMKSCAEKRFRAQLFPVNLYRSREVVLLDHCSPAFIAGVPTGACNWLGRSSSSVDQSPLDALYWGMDSEPSCRLARTAPAQVPVRRRGRIPRAVGFGRSVNISNDK
jgi:hypothetical protein